jgi:hypothetical protein
MMTGSMGIASKFSVLNYENLGPEDGGLLPVFFERSRIKNGMIRITCETGVGAIEP